jgi:hypothetical protein
VPQRTFAHNILPSQAPGKNVQQIQKGSNKRIRDSENRNPGGFWREMQRALAAPLHFRGRVRFVSKPQKHASHLRPAQQCTKTHQQSSDSQTN